MPAAKANSFLSWWQALLLFKWEGLKFHSVLYNDWFFPIVKQRGHLITNLVFFFADMGKKNGWINPNVELLIELTVISLLKHLTLSTSTMPELRPFWKQIVPTGQKLEDSIHFWKVSNTLTERKSVKLKVKLIWAGTMASVF